MAEIVARGPRREAASPRPPGSCCGPPSADGGDDFTVTETGDGWRVRGEKPERWVRQTDFSNDEAVGFLADRLNRLGVETRLRPAGRPGGRRRPHRRTPTTPWSSTSSPASTPAPRCSAAAARTSASTSSGRPPGAAATIDEAMPERAESETRADVARRLDQEPAEQARPDGLRDRLGGRPGLGRVRPRRLTDEA